MNLLVTGSFSWEKDEINILKDLGHEIIFMQQETDDLPCAPEWVEGIIGNGILLKHPIQQFTSLQYIQLTSAGYDRVPMEYIKNNKIRIFNAMGVYSVPMAEFAVMSVLQLLKHSKFFLENQKEHKWIKNRNIIELSEKIVCIVGCGNVGTECAKRFSSFCCKVIGVDSSPYQSEYFETILHMNDFEQALSISDVVILTLPLTEDTRGMMDAKRFSVMKDGAILVNIARGPIVKTDDLISALNNKLGGAVLDVFEEEPLSKKSILWDLKSVIITPHNSFVGDGNHKRMFKIIFNNLRSWSI